MPVRLVTMPYAVGFINGGSCCAESVMVAAAWHHRAGGGAGGRVSMHCAVMSARGAAAAADSVLVPVTTGQLLVFDGSGGCPMSLLLAQTWAVVPLCNTI